MESDGRLSGYALNPLLKSNDTFSPLGSCGIYMEVLSREVVRVSNEFENGTF